MANRKALRMVVIYDHPTDHPDHYVAREFSISVGKVNPGEIIDKSTDVWEIRKRMEQEGLNRIERDEFDDEKILESWI